MRPKHEVGSLIRKGLNSEEIRKRVFNLQDCHIADTTSIRKAMDEREYNMRTEAKKNLDLINENLDLIISSYKYRLVELCKGLEAQGFMYQYQYDHLSEFYHLYRNLGGNGQAQDYYEKDKIRRLGEDACNPHRIRYKKLER